MTIKRPERDTRDFNLDGSQPMVRRRSADDGRVSKTLVNG